jgi:hypothetical protein
MVVTLKRPIVLESLGVNRYGFEFVGKAVEGVFFAMKKAFDERGIAYQYVADIPPEFGTALASKEILSRDSKKLLHQN